MYQVQDIVQQMIGVRSYCVIVKDAFMVIENVVGGRVVLTVSAPYTLCGDDHKISNHFLLHEYLKTRLAWVQCVT